jgi:leucyl aminopeptidase
MHIHFHQDLSHLPKNNVVFIDENYSRTEYIKALEQQYKVDVIAILQNSKFENKFGKMLFIPSNSSNAPNIIAVSVGKVNELDQNKFTNLGAKIYSLLLANKLNEVGICTQSLLNGKLSSHEVLTLLSFGLQLRSYKFDKYFTDQKKKRHVVTVYIIDPQPEKVEELYNNYKAILAGIELAKNLATEPPNVKFPENFAKHCESLKDLDVEVEILDEKAIRKLGMGAFLGVAQGSVKEPRLVIMKWHGGDKGEAPIAFCGKGVTFDSGGLSLKPAEAMEDMKYDATGAALVTGLMKTLALRKAKVNVVGIIGLTENMPDGNAQRPGDVVTSMSGQTIEILNTDAEGRLILADVLWYTQSVINPKLMIDLATLTGAIVITFADQYAGLFSNDDVLSQQLTDAGIKVNEKLWRLPLGSGYDKMIESPIADMQNISKGRGGGSITAAQFLQKFVNKKTWAHLDIAGVSWDKKGSDLHAPGATGFGIRLLNKFIIDHYEQ